MIFEKMTKILKEVTEDEELSISINSDLIEETELDSLTMIKFIIAIEDEFDIEIDYDELDFEQIKTVSSFITLIEEKIKSRGE